MRRITRHLFTILSALSLLLCVAMLLLWFASYWRMLGIDRREPLRRSACSISRGIIFLGRQITREDYNAPPYGWSALAVSPAYDLSPRLTLPAAVSWGGFWIRHDRDSVAGAVDEALLPGWFVVGVLSLLPIAWWKWGRKWRLQEMRLAKSQCLACGYDLRASPERCPECGTANPRGVTREAASSS